MVRACLILCIPSGFTQSLTIPAVIYLDADTVVVQNSDELFSCPGFCATLRHSERFNSGVMVITPSKRLFRTMMDSINVMHSYTGRASVLLHSICVAHSSWQQRVPAIDQVQISRYI